MEPVFKLGDKIRLTEKGIKRVYGKIDKDLMPFIQDKAFDGEVTKIIPVKDFFSEKNPDGRIVGYWYDVKMECIGRTFGALDLDQITRY